MHSADTNARIESCITIMADYYNVLGHATKDNNNEHKDQSTTSSAKGFQFTSRRSPVICRNGCVASSQPLASSIGLDILRNKPGANAADAAIAVAAALTVLEPCSTGLGGDMFALYYDASSRRVSCVNGSGRAPSNLTIEAVKRYNEQQAVQVQGDSFIADMQSISPHCVTVPGAARGWEDFLTKHGSGKITLQELVEPAAQLAEEGFPVAPLTANHWASDMSCVEYWYDQLYQQDTPTAAAAAIPNVPFTVQDTNEPPQAGQIYRNPHLAKVLRSLGTYGATDGFYNAFPGKALVETLQALGGLMTLEDLRNHTSTFPDPIGAEYRDVKLWQVPPNGQGIAGLIALKSLDALEKSNSIDVTSCTSTELYHVMIEMMRLGFADGRAYVADLDYNNASNTNTTNTSSSNTNIGSVEWLLDSQRISNRANKLYNPRQATIQGYPDPTSCTVSFQVVDKEGNAVSFVNSNYMGFGTGIVPTGCGFSLQNRGYGFSLDPSHPNSLQPSKRPYHTIIPGILTYADTNELYATISNMGGFMQPQGHLQLTVNLVARGLDSQAAVDEPRFCIADGTYNGMVMLEEGVSEDTNSSLVGMGHDIVANISGYNRSVFGKAQVITRDRMNGVWWAGSDGRADGCAMGY